MKAGGCCCGAAVGLTLFGKGLAFIPSVKLAQKHSSTEHITSPWVGSGGRVEARVARSLRETRIPSMLETAEAHGVVQFVAENKELAVEETVEVIYTPPREMFQEVDALLYCGGFNGWDGENDGITLPMLPLEDGRYSVNINIPNFARTLDFTVTDGVRYDTGPGGSFYHAIVTHVREADKEGNVITYHQAQDGTLTKTGVIEVVDPQELERMIEQASRAQQAPELAAPLVDDAIGTVNENLKNEIIVTIDEQEAVQRMRAEASVLGERLGLGNMQVNEARDVFDIHDNKDGMLPFEALGTVLTQLGFDEVGAEQQSDLLGEFVLGERPDAEAVTLNEFMHIFSHLDKEDVGIDIV